MCEVTQHQLQQTGANVAWGHAATAATSGIQISSQIKLEQSQQQAGAKVVSSNTVIITKQTNKQTLA